MPNVQHAVVSYLAGPLAEFVSQLRSQLSPAQPPVAPHITHLPPCLMQCTEEEAKAAIRALCARRDVAPFRVSVSEVACFAPATPTIYLAIKDGARHLHYLHGLLNSALVPSPKEAEAVWPFVPHVTLARFELDSEIAAALPRAKQAWSRYAGPRDFAIEEITFVRELPAGGWLDLETFHLGE